MVLQNLISAVVMGAYHIPRSPSQLAREIPSPILQPFGVSFSTLRGLQQDDLCLAPIEWLVCRCVETRLSCMGIVSESLGVSSLCVCS